MAAPWGGFYVCLPRIYHGLHDLSDILAGAALGSVLALLVLHMPLPAALRGGRTGLAARMP